jgi:hypothetical protein
MRTKYTKWTNVSWNGTKKYEGGTIGSNEEEIEAQSPTTQDDLIANVQR